MPFSGKSEAVKIAKDKNIPVLRMGDMVWEETKKQGLEINDPNVGKVANDMRKAHGMDIWAKKTYEKIKDIKNEKILVIDGIRNREESDFFKEKLGKDFIIVAVTVSDEERYERAMNRNRADDSKDLNKIKERDRRELSWGLDKVIKNADIKISNEDDIKLFRNEIKKVFENQ